MAYKYGDKRTAYNGICLWMQNDRELCKLSSTQLFKHIDDCIKSYLKSKGIKLPKIRTKQNTWHFDLRKASIIIQGDFESFKTYIKSLKNDVI